MRNPILAVAIAVMLAAPCTALAGEKEKQKEKWIELQSSQFGVGRVGPAKTKAPTITPTGTTGLTAKGTLGGSTGPTKLPLPTSGGTNAK